MDINYAAAAHCRQYILYSYCYYIVYILLCLSTIFLIKFQCTSGLRLRLTLIPL